MAVLQHSPRYSVLAFVEQSKHYDHNAPYNSAKVTQMVNTPLGIIPPFQFVKSDDWNFVSVELVHYATGTATDILTAILATGMMKTAYDGTGGYGEYSVWQYPGSVALPVTVAEGAHYLRMQDANGSWVLSELFTFIDGLEVRKDYIKVEWWHLTDLILSCGPDGKSLAHIKYEAPFKWWVYLKTALAFHGWKYEEENEKRDGIEFVKKITRFKEYSFKFSAPEYMVDAVSMIPLNEKRKVTYLGQEHEDIWRFMPEAQPVGAGNLYGVEVIFQTNRTTVSVNGAGYSDTSYITASGECLEDNIERGLIMSISTPEYAGAYFLNDVGALINLQNGDIVFADTGSIMVVRQWNGSSYHSLTPADYTNFFAIYDARATGVNATRGQYYFFYKGGALYDAPQWISETSGTPWHVNGSTFSNSLLQVVVRDASDNEWIAATVTSDVFNASGVDFLITENGKIGTAYKLRAATWQCPNIAESEWFVLEGVDYDIIESTLEVYADVNDTPTPDDPDE